MHKRISNIEVMGEYLMVASLKILCPEKKSLCKNIQIMLEPFPPKWMVRVTIFFVGLHSVARRSTAV